MGTVFQIPWGFLPKKKTENPAEDSKRKPEEYAVNVELLKELGYTTVAMALTDRSVSIADEHLQQAEKLAILLGNENFGLWCF